MILFLYEGTATSSDALVRKALRIFGTEKNTEYPEDAVILRTEKGKPYFKDFPEVHFSVSHTGQMWICLMADHNVGVDIQEKKSVRSKEITDRYFGPSEEHYVALWGDYGFFDLWVRKEALVKFRGTTLMEEMGREVAQDGDLKDEIVIDGETIFLAAVDMGESVKCAYATEKKEDVSFEFLE